MDNNEYESTDLPFPGERFTYSYRGVEKAGTVVRAELDECLEIVVDVRFDDGEETTFWNSSFYYPALDEKITHHR